MKAAFIISILLLVASLATSGYLLMEQSKSRVMIDESLQESTGLKKKTLEISSQKTAVEKEHAQLKSVSIGISNKLNEALSQLTEAESQSRLEREKNEKLIALNMENEKNTSNQLNKLASELAGARSDFNSTNVKLTGELIDSTNRVNEISNKLDGASQALKAFLSTGLTPQEIVDLKRIKPVKITAPNIISPQVIRPGKLTTPIQVNPKTP